MTVVYQCTINNGEVTFFEKFDYISVIVAFVIIVGPIAPVLESNSSNRRRNIQLLQRLLWHPTLVLMATVEFHNTTEDSSSRLQNGDDKNGNGLENKNNMSTLLLYDLADIKVSGGSPTPAEADYRYLLYYDSKYDK